MPRPGKLFRPPPGADRRPVELQCRHDEEDARVRGTSPRAPEEREQQGDAERTCGVQSRQHRQSEHAPDRDGRGREEHEGARVTSQRFAQRQAGHEHEPVGRRNEGRQVVQPVGVDAPQNRAGQLRQRCRANDHRDLRPAFGRQRPRGDEEHDPGDASKCELAGQLDLRVDRQQRRQKRGDQSCANQRLNCSSCQEGTGASSSSARSPFGSL